MIYWKCISLQTAVPERDAATVRPAMSRALIIHEGDYIRWHSYQGLFTGLAVCFGTVIKTITTNDYLSEQ